MPVGILGTSAFLSNQLEVEGQGAARVTLTPVDVGIYGSYRKAMTSGTIAANLGAASLVYGFRWAPTPNTLLCLVRRVMITMGNVTAFAAGFIAMNMFAARSYSVLETSGGTLGTYSTNNAKLRTSFAASAGVTNYMTTTAAISGGTATLDADPMGQLSTSVTATAGAPPTTPTNLFSAAPGECPLILANQEGFVIKATVPATGTWQLGVTVDWDEVPATWGV